jgi:hypothetical protein
MMMHEKVWVEFSRKSYLAHYLGTAGLTYGMLVGAMIVQ